MKKHSRSPVTILILLVTQWVLSALSQGPSVAKGVWEGTITVARVELDIIVTLDGKEDGSWTGTIDIPAQRAKDLALGNIVVKESSVSFVIRGVPGDPTFKGNLSADGNTISGDFTQGGQTFPFKLNRKTEAKPDRKTETKPNRPQEPKKPFPYDEEEVAYENKKAGIKLTGTLTRPRSKGPFPAVLLITGSGPQDRDETVFGHKPFLVLADYLTRQGLAVLRVDDRGMGGSTGNVNDATTEEFADDVLAGVEYLKGRKEINAKRIGLIGHSEGGAIAPIAASKSNDVAFIVMMAGPGLTGEELLYLQGALIAKASGASDEGIAKTRAAQERIFGVVKTEKDPAAAEKKLRELGNELMAGMTEGQKKAGGSNVIEDELKRVLTPWFRFFLTYDPRPVLMKIKCPVLAINGERDLQVPYKENLTAIEAALKVGGNKDATIVKLANLNHLLQTSQTGSLAEYSKIEETISPTALQVISDWILKHTR